MELNSITRLQPIRAPKFDEEDVDAEVANERRFAEENQAYGRDVGDDTTLHDPVNGIPEGLRTNDELAENLTTEDFNRRRAALIEHFMATRY